MFSHIQSTQIQGGNFVQNVTNHNVSAQLEASAHHGQQGLNLLLKHVVAGALLVARERSDSPRCSENTRAAIIREILYWIDTTDTNCLILWIYGGAGAGKTAIAQTLCETLRSRRRLLASHFFSRTSDSTDRSDGHRFIPNLAYQLILFFPELKPFIGDRLDFNPLIFEMAPKEQFDYLVILPLRYLGSSFFVKVCDYFRTLKSLWMGQDLVQPFVIVIDGLDECSNPRDQLELLRIITASLFSFPIPIRVVVLSRPEKDIRGFFENSDAYIKANNFHSIDLDKDPNAEADIRTFLDQEFERIVNTHPRKQYLGKGWPSVECKEQIIRKSPSHFIFPAVAISYIRDPDEHPEKRLEIILGISPPPKDDTPFYSLDILYSHIFSSAKKKDKSTIDVAIGVLYLYQIQPGSPLFIPQPSYQTLDALMCLSPGSTEASMKHLTSLMIEPKDDKHPLSFRHASVFDFLLDKTRSGQFSLSCRDAYDIIYKSHRQRFSKLLSCEPSVS